MNIKIRGIKYHFEIHQQEEHLPTLVLLHGFMGSGQVFEPIIDKMKRCCNPITLDLLGHGQTEGAEMHYRFNTTEQVADLAKWIKEQLAPPVFLYGYSMGARLALNLAIHHQNLLQGLILESGSFGIEDPTERQTRQALDASRADQIMGNFKGFIKEWEKQPLFGNSTSAKLTSIHLWQNPTWIANSLLGFGSGTMPNLRPQLCNILVPVLLLVGEKDSKYVRINQTMNRELPNSELKIVSQSHHRVHTERPDALSEVLTHFITNHTLPSLGKP